MDKNVRTDLALEERESFPGDGGEISGVALREWSDKKTHIKLTEVKILDKKGEAAMGKPVGTYITIEADKLSYKDENYHEEISVKIAEQIRALADNISCGDKNICESAGVLIVGLGNSSVTPDSLGPRVLNNIMMTRHLNDRGDVPPISGIIPGVMAQTGMESAEIIKGIISETHPGLVIVIDALAARSIRRLGTTIQLTDTGIHPGSGVGNNRHGLTLESLGVPVLAIGVPTVVGAAAIVHDTFSAIIKMLKTNPSTSAVSDVLDKSGPKEQYALIVSLLEPEFGSMYVTKPDIDETVKMISYTISEGIHKAFLHML